METDKTKTHEEDTDTQKTSAREATDGHKENEDRSDIQRRFEKTVRTGNYKEMVKLLEKGARGYQRNARGITPLMAALVAFVKAQTDSSPDDKLIKAEEKVIERLLKSGGIDASQQLEADLEVEINGKKINFKGNSITDLMEQSGMFQRQPMLVWKVIKEGAPVGPLKRNPQSIRALILQKDKKGNEIKDENGKPKILLKLIPALLKKGFTIEQLLAFDPSRIEEIKNVIADYQKNAQEKLIEAAKAGDIEGMQIAIEFGADVNKSDNSGNNAIYYITQHAISDPMKALLKLGELASDSEMALDLWFKGDLFSRPEIVDKMREMITSRDEKGKTTFHIPLLQKLFDQGNRLKEFFKQDVSLIDEIKAALTTAGSDEDESEAGDDNIIDY